MKKGSAGETKREQANFQEELDKVYIDKQASLKWLKDGRLGYNDEHVILAVQDQALMTNGFKKMAGLSDFVMKQLKMATT